MGTSTDIPAPPRTPSPHSPPTPSHAPTPGLSAGDLAELHAAFNLVTSRLTATHETLTAEVARLRAELHDANEQLQRSKRLAALGEMAAGISHEIRNPLGSILLYTRMLRDDLADRPPQRDLTDKIASAVQRLNAVVGDVLAFSREIKPRTVPLDTAEVFSAAIDAAHDGSTAWHAVAIRRPAIAPPAQTLHADPVLLQQALVNILRNAVEAMAELPAGAPRILALHAAPRRVPKPARDADRTPLSAMIVLSIRDSGPGIDPAVAQRLFNPFFTTRAAGTGLGLAIVARILDAHGGGVSIRNAADAGLPPLDHPATSGAVVEILLPDAPAPAAEPARTSA